MPPTQRPDGLLKPIYLSPSPLTSANQVQHLCPFPVKHHLAASEALSDSSCQALQGLAMCLALVRG